MKNKDIVGRGAKIYTNNETDKKTKQKAETRKKDGRKMLENWRIYLKILI